MAPIGVQRQALLTERLRSNLSLANFTGATLSDADLSGTSLSGALLRGANLSGAKLGSANLSGADLDTADLNGANLNGSNFGLANLSNAQLTGVHWQLRTMRGGYLGIRGLDSCFGNALFKRAAADQDFLDTLEAHLKGNPPYGSVPCLGVDRLRP